MRLKKLSPFMLFMALILALAACGSTNTSSDNGSAKGTEKAKEISIFQSKVEIAKPLEELAKKYTEKTGIKVNVWGTTGDSYATHLQTKLASNQGPTIFDVSPGAQAQKFKSYLYDMSDQPYVKNIAPNMALKIDGKIVGVPYGVEGYGLVYNKSLVDPKNITDYDSFVSALKKFKSKGINGLGLSKEAYFLIGHMINYPFALQKDPKAFIKKLDEGKTTMAGNKVFQDFAKYMVAIRKYTKNPLKVSYDDEIGDFAKGKDAMIHQGNWCYSMFKDYGDLGFKMSMMPFPLEKNNKLAVGVASNWVINKNASKAQIKAANDFLNWMLTSDVGKKYIVQKFKFIPAMTNIDAKGQLDPLSEAVLKASNSGQTIPWTFNYFPPGVITNDLLPVAQQFFMNKDMTGEQFLKKLDEAWANSVK
ncbi:MAG TPA: ABC transporter substrate-binding protein [Bacillales bacterium]|nr:ABC transporter substrate-binding protein [Bacillales bacterium]